MREIMKRTVAAVMAVLIACAAAGCSSTGNSSSGSSSAGETTTTTAPIVEDMGNLDLSDVTTEYDVPEDFSYESEAEKGTLSGGAAVLDKNFLGAFSGDGFVSIGSSGDMVPLQDMDWYNNENGIVSLCWHWYAPEKNLEKNGGAWWQGFYSEYTDFDLAKALSGEDKEGYDSIIADLDHMAGVLKELADANVPILWRPLHEAAGDPKYPGNAWFWWGSAGKDAYIQLWQLMYDKFTNEYGLNNLIWVWNAQNPDWYPGDEYVDIMGYDCYPAERDSSSQKWYYDLVKSSTSTNKIIAMTENGSMFDPDGAFNDGTRWAWFSTWNGEFCIKDKQLSDQYTTFDEWNKIYNSERVLTLDELPNLKCYPMDTEKYLEEHK